ncbi:hypothetical protein VE00_08489 [Pseudogymnoascus sp. WSF 3629]|nr:hypothetical protein VE00_08489 [Pseudogymnoascus sp. WSF 3629]
MHHPHSLTRGDYIHLSLRTITILLSATALAILLHIHLSFHRTFSLSIAAATYALFLDIFILLLFTSRYRPALRQVIKWLWFFELCAVVLLGVGFAWLFLGDFGREARTGGTGGEYVYRDAEDLGWRMRGAWVLVVVMILHFGFMVLGCVDACVEKRRGRFKG